jgi:N-acetylglucosamine-6-phosphate deacetylase
MINIAGVPLIDSVKMMTYTPARMMKIDQQKGSIKNGKDADFVIFDDNINVLYTILEGHVIYGN